MIEKIMREWLRKYCASKYCENCALKDRETCWDTEGSALKENYYLAQVDVINNFHSFIHNRFNKKQ